MIEIAGAAVASEAVAATAETTLATAETAVAIKDVGAGVVELSKTEVAADFNIDRLAEMPKAGSIISNKGFDIDKLAEMPKTVENVSDKGFDIDKLAEMPKVEDNASEKTLDIDKRTEISPGRETSGEKKFDVDKKTEIPQARDIGNKNTNGDAAHENASEQRDDNMANIESNDVTLFSTEKERIDHTPREDSSVGDWEGERGNSKFIPIEEDMKKHLSEYGCDGIEYKKGVVDFSPVSETNVQIDMTSQRYGPGGNFEKCDAKCAEQWNAEKREGKDDWTARDVEKWRGENHYTWHECSDMKTCMLVSRDIHETFIHSGGVSECIKRDQINYGGGFDE